MNNQVQHFFLQEYDVQPLHHDENFNMHAIQVRLIESCLCVCVCVCFRRSC